MVLKRVTALLKKDFAVLTRSSSFTGAVLGPTIAVSIVLPVLLLTPNPLAAAPATVGQWLSTLLERMPPAMRAEIGNMTQRQAYVYVAAVYYLMPFFLIKAVTATSAAAAEAFTAERFGGTIDSILFSPVTGTELICTKTISCVVPAVVANWFCFCVYTLVVNVLGWPTMKRIFFPTSLWILQEAVAIPLLSLTICLVTMVAAARFRSAREAHQLSSVLVIPLVAVFFGQAAGLLYLDRRLLAVVVVASTACIVALAYVVRLAWSRRRLGEWGL